MFRVRPVLSIGYWSASLMARGELDGVEERLRRGRAVAGPDGRDRAAEMVVVDEEEFRTLPGAIAMYRAGTALVRGDVAGTMTHARRALDLAGEDDHLARGAAAALLGLAYWTTGTSTRRAGWYVDAHGEPGAGRAPLRRARAAPIALADIRIAQGRLREAMRTYERGTAARRAGRRRCSGARRTCTWA